MRTKDANSATYFNNIGMFESQLSDLDVVSLDLLDYHRPVRSGALDHRTIDVVLA